MRVLNFARSFNSAIFHPPQAHSRRRRWAGFVLASSLFWNLCDSGLYAIATDGSGAITLLATSTGAAIDFVGSLIFQPCAAVPGGLLAWWQAEGNADDVAGNHHGTLQNGVTFGTGRVGQAFNFDGTSAAIETVSTDVMNKLPLTLEAWVNPALRDDGDFFPSNVFSNDEPGNFGHGFGVNVFPNGSQLLIEYQDGFRVSPDVRFAAGQWYHVAVVYAPGNLKVYVNGAQVDDFNYAQGPLDGAGLIRLGKHNDDAATYGTRRFFKGLIDEAAIYNRALSGVEVQAIYSAGSTGKCVPQCLASPNGLVSLWPGNGNAVDIIGGNTGTLQNGTVFAPGEVGPGFNFDGVNDSVRIPNAPNLRPNRISVEAWVKAAKPGVQPGFVYLVSKSLLDQTKWASYGLYTGGGGGLSFYVALGNFFTAAPVASASLWDGNFHHTVGTYDGSAVRLFVDGVQVGNGTPASGDIVYGTDQFNGDLFLGAVTDTGRYPFGGVVDEVGIYSRALSPQEVQALFNAGSVGKCPPPPCIPAPAGLVAWLPGNGHALDVASNHHGTLRAGGTYPAGIAGQAFNGIVEVPHAPELNFEATSPLSVECWVYRTGAASGMHILGKRVGCDGNVNNIHYQLAFDSARGLSFGGYSPNDVETGIQLPFNTWQHLAGTFDGTNYRFYIDGRLIKTSPGTLGPANNEPLLIGSSGGCAPFEGLIDEVALYNRALTDAEVQAIFNAGGSGKCRPPFIITQAQSQAVAAGDSVSISVTADGSLPLNYQWRLNGVNIPGAHQPTLTFASVQGAQAGIYTVVIANATGSVTSDPAQLRISESYTLDLPAGISLIANQLHRGNNTVGEVLPEVPDDAVLFKFVLAAGSFVVNQFVSGGWLDPNMSLAPGEGVLIELPAAAKITFSGERRPPQLPLTLGNGLNFVASQLPQTASYVDIVGEPPTEGTVVYQPREFGSALEFNATNYRINVFRDGTWHDQEPLVDVGEAVLITRLQSTAITTQPASQLEVAPGSTVTLSVVATGAGPFRYQWRRNGVNLLDKTNATLVIPNVQAGDSGNYTVAVDNDLGAINSNTATVRVNVPALNLANIFAERITMNDTARAGRGLNVGANKEPGEPTHAGKPGGASVWMTWVSPATGIATFDTRGSSFDTVLAVYTGDTLVSLNEVANDDDRGGFLTSLVSFNAVAGTAYQIAVDGFNGASGDVVLNWNLEVTPDLLPEITTQPQSQTVPLGANTAFTIVATGGNLSYQWFFNGTALAGETAATLTRNNVQTSAVGSYTMRVTSGNRFSESQPAILQVNQPAAGSQVEPVRTTDKFADTLLGVGRPIGLQGFFGPRRVIKTTLARGFTGTQIFSTYGSSKEQGEPNHCGIAGGASQWFAYEAPASGQLTLNTDGSDFDTVLAVYTGTGADFSTLVPVACDNDSGLDGRDSHASFAATGGTIYFIAVDGVNAVTGAVTLNYSLATPLQIASVQLLSPDRFTFQLIGPPGGNYTIQSTADFLSWTTLLSTNPISGIVDFRELNIPSFEKRFYRAFQQ